LVVDKGGRLVALIYPDFENSQKAGIDPSQLEPMMEKSIKELNAELPAYSQLSGVKIMPVEFEKTPKHSIKRYLYQT
ncbi:MAG: long-chain fatty acid--CoA ligase, partial [Muribaculaceae bacterium]|nr:long-chain fatty acid--CoA ligase [Muribaculaceae bacterium]